MKFLAFLFALIAAITSLGTLLLGFMLTMTDNPSSPVLPWGYSLIFVGFLMVLLGVLSVILVWIRPAVADKALWLLILDGLIGMVIVTIAMTVAPAPGGPSFSIAASNLLMGGLMPAIAAYAALIMLRKVDHGTPAGAA
jgi:hypothetical protein